MTHRRAAEPRYELDGLVDDPIADAIRRGASPRTLLTEALERLVEPGCRLLDLGAHVGTTALPAAAAGARAIAVEPDPRLAAALRASVAASGLADAVEVVEAAAADRAGRLSFSPAGPWGHVTKTAQPDDVEERIEVDAVRGADLIERAGWNEPDLVKASVGGFERHALVGLATVLRARRRLPGRPDRRPVLLLESNAHALSWYGGTPRSLREDLAELGYAVHLIDWKRPGRLVPFAVDAIQPECTGTLVCAPGPDDLLSRGWRIEPFSREELLERLLEACCHESTTDRWHAARELEHAPEWLREDARVREALDLLNGDRDAMVRDAALWADRTQPGGDEPEAYDAAPRMRTVALPDGTPVAFALPPAMDTPIARDLMASETYPLHAANRLLLAAVRPGQRLLDLGAHLGTFSIPAALRGAEVVAVEPHPGYARLIERSIAENGVGDRVTLVEAAAGAAEGEVDLVLEFEWSFLAPAHVELEGRRADSRRTPVLVLPPRAVLERAGWETADLVKIDVEGFEIDALAGMEEVLARPDAPPVLFESNDPALALQGASAPELLRVFDGHGYSLYLLAHEDGEWWLVPVEADVFQVEASEEMLAVKGPPPELPGWTVRDPMTRAEQVGRVVRVAGYPYRNYRRLIADRLRSAPSWLLEDPSVAEALEVLRNDVDGDVRDAAAWSRTERS